MRKNKLKQIWLEGGAAVNGWLHISSSWSAEVMANAGYDSVTIDFQHGFHNMETALAMLQAISTTDTVPLVRAPWNEPVMIQRLLDAGAYGMICPVIETREECEKFIGACRYFPMGYRSKGPTRAKVYGGSDYALHANKEIVTMAMVETAKAVENLDGICSVEGLDALFVGPGDLALTMGSSQGLDLTEPELVAALDEILAAAKRHNLVAGIFCGTPQYARQMIEKGWQFVTVSSDTSLLSNAAAQSIAAARGEKLEKKQSSGY